MARTPFKNISGPEAFTLMECMTTIVVLAVGLVMVYRVLLMSLEHQDYISQRLFTSSAWINELEWLRLRTENQSDFEPETASGARFYYWNRRPLSLTVQAGLKAVPEIEGLATLDVSLSWQNRGKRFFLENRVYVSPKTKIE